MRVRKCILLRTRISYLNHGNIIKYCGRPFLSEKDKKELSARGAWVDGIWHKDKAGYWRMSEEAVGMMDQTIIDNINAVVGEDDELWHLGDFAFGNKHDYYQTCRSYRDRIKCRNVNIIWGNHDDRCIRDLFNEAYDLKRINRFGQNVVLCHYAMAIWDGSHKGTIMLFGHSHSEAEDWLDKVMPGRRSMDVGVDNAYKILGEFKPFSFEFIQEQVGSKNGFSFDHHVGKGSNTPDQS